MFVFVQLTKTLNFLYAVPGKMDYKELSLKLVCSIDQKDCMMNRRTMCPGKDNLITYLNNLFVAGYDSDILVNYILDK